MSLKSPLGDNVHAERVPEPEPYPMELLYHVVYIPKRRRKKVFGTVRRHLGEMFPELSSQKESKIVEGHLMPDHIHMCIKVTQYK